MSKRKPLWTVRQTLDPLPENVLAHSVAKNATRNGRSAARGNRA